MWVFAARWFDRVCAGSVSGLCSSLCFDGAARLRSVVLIVLSGAGSVRSFGLFVFAPAFCFSLRPLGRCGAPSLAFFLSRVCTFLFALIFLVSGLLATFFVCFFVLFSFFFYLACQLFAKVVLAPRKIKFSFERSAHLGAEMFRTRRAEACRELQEIPKKEEL